MYPSSPGFRPERGERLNVRRKNEPRKSSMKRFTAWVLNDTPTLSHPPLLGPSSRLFTVSVTEIEAGHAHKDALGELRSIAEVCQGHHAAKYHPGELSGE